MSFIDSYGKTVPSHIALDAAGSLRPGFRHAPPHIEDGQYVSFSVLMRDARSGLLKSPPSSEAASPQIAALYDAMVADLGNAWRGRIDAPSIEADINPGDVSGAYTAMVSDMTSAWQRKN